MREVPAMTKLFLLKKAQMRRKEPHFPCTHGKPRVDNRRVLKLTFPRHTAIH